PKNNKEQAPRPLSFFSSNYYFGRMRGKIWVSRACFSIKNLNNSFPPIPNPPLGGIPCSCISPKFLLKLCSFSFPFLPTFFPFRVAYAAPQTVPPDRLGRLIRYTHSPLRFHPQSPGIVVPLFHSFHLSSLTAKHQLAN